MLPFNDTRHPTRPAPFWPAMRLLMLGVFLSLVLGWLAACSTPYREMVGEPAFGQSVRSGLKAQERPSEPAQVVGVPFTELEPALDRQQKAKPPETTPNRSGGLTGSSTMGL